MTRRTHRPQHLVFRTPQIKTANVFLLHSMASSAEEFTELSEKLTEFGCDVFCLASPIRYSEEGEGVASWYDYRTWRNGEDAHDVINTRHLNEEADRVVDFINVIQTNSHVPALLGGTSQGGTIVFHILATKNVIIDAYFCARSCFLHSYARSKLVKNTKLFTFEAGDDEVYSPDLQHLALRELLKDNEICHSNLRKAGLLHNSTSILQNKSIISFVRSVIEKM